MITRPISKSISRGIAVAINDPNGAGFNPLSLFAAGEQGVWYDPSDFSTLFQDAAGTIPVTAAGQPVGMMRDKSGRGNHASQATATSRPILQTAGGKWFLAFDGVDDWMSTGGINFSPSTKTMSCAGVRKLNNVGLVFEFSASITANVGAFAMPVTAAGWTFRHSGTLIADAPATGIPAPATAVMTGVGDIGAPSSTIRVNGAQAATSSASQGTGTLGNYPLYFMRRAGTGTASMCNFYGLIIRGAASTAQQITDTESYMNSKTGAY